MVKKLDVFLSSSIGEFRNERRYLSKKISDMPYLECIPQEAKGSLSQGPAESSVEDAQKCDILVGILGDCYSKITMDEINSVIELGKYRVLYVKESETRDERVSEFISELSEHHVVSESFKRGSGDLYPKVLSNLQDHMYRILAMGLEDFEAKHKKVVQTSEKAETETKTKIKNEQYTLNKILQDAESSLINGNYLASVVECVTLIEYALKNWVIKTKLLPEHSIQKQSLGRLVRLIRDEAVIESTYIHNMTEIRMIRNEALHTARIPSQQDARTVMHWTKELLNMLEIRSANENVKRLE